MQFVDSLEAARAMDATDPLKEYRGQFLLPQHNGKAAIYFLGNSLGLQPTSTAANITTVLQQWQQYGVEAFFKGDNPWLDYHQKLQQLLAPVVGALPNEVVVMNALTVNLHLMLATFYQPSGKRKKIICEAKAFPSDQYMLQTHLEQRGLAPKEIIIEVAPRRGELTINEEDIVAAITDCGDELALLFWGGVNYYTGQAFHLQKLTAAAHKAGAVAGFDLAHAAGNVPLELHHWNVDFACWCSYKYLNSGPGAIGGNFIHQKHHNKNLKRFGGWWGYKKEDRFLMQQAFVPEAGAEGWQLSTPSPIQYAAHQTALQQFASVGLEPLFTKGRRLNNYLFFLLDQLCKTASVTGLQLITPTAEEARGQQVSILVKKGGRKVFDYLTANGVFADWREPDVIRMAPVPLYNSFEEVWQVAQLLKKATAENNLSL